MRRFSHLAGSGVFGSDDDMYGIRLWNRLEFRRGRGWAELTVMAMDDAVDPRRYFANTPVTVAMVNWLMDMLIECGGDDVEPLTLAPPECPPNCENGYLRQDDGNYEPCPSCRQA